MDFMKVIDQTVREIKREVNMKVLKVPEIEQKVLDATNNEPWGPHGSALAEIARATKKFTECQIIMNVLLTRLTDTGRNWRHVYKALAVIEYLIANGSERALDDVLEHTSKISSISGFEYVEPSGKDMGINVRKKVETIMAILDSKDKIQEVRNKAATNRDKYFGLSSTGITYKSSATSSFHQDDSRYGGLSSAGEGETLTDGYKERNRHGVETDWNRKKRDGFGMDGQNTSQSQSGNRRENDLKKGSVQYDRDEDDNYGHIPSSQSLGATPNNIEDDFDDFDPRGSSSTGAAAVEPNKSSLFGDNLIDLMDAPVSVPTESTPSSNASNEVDLFADATFVSATPHVEAQFGSHTKQANVDLFAQSALPASSASTVDFFAAPDPSLQPVTATSKSETTNTNMVDPFAAVPLNNFYGSDLFGDFTSHTGPVSTEPVENSSHDGLSLNTNTSTISKPPQKKDSFQVKSGIWADSLSRGLIDLNISAPKKVSLADIGIVGALSDGSDEKEKVLPSSAYMGRAMGVGTSLGRSGFSSSATGMAAGAHFSNLNQH